MMPPRKTPLSTLTSQPNLSQNTQSYVFSQSKIKGDKGNLEGSNSADLHASEEL